LYGVQVVPSSGEEVGVGLREECQGGRYVERALNGARGCIKGIHTV